MYMDSALKLRILSDEGKLPRDSEILDLLNSSQLVADLTADFVEKPLYSVWRIIALSEIPYAKKLQYTQQVIQYIERNLATPMGFSLTGKEADLLPCYNAMLLEAFSNLGHHQSGTAQNALAWIKKFQPFERNMPITWTGKAIHKYGGCMKATPCFIGLAKSVKALVSYSKAIHHEDKEVEALIDKGMEYLLKHELYKRLSTADPINKHILDLAFPASYQLNIVELLELAFLTGHINDNRCSSSLDYVRNKRTKNGTWKTNYIYKADGYLSFDKRGAKGDWITYLLGRYI